MATILTSAAALLWRAVPLATEAFGARGYRTARFTQKMGKKHFKGRGAKSYGYLTSKGAERWRAMTSALSSANIAA
jgi:hypothetical protein